MTGKIITLPDMRISPWRGCAPAWDRENRILFYMEAEQYSFYLIPKMLFTAEYFRSLSCEAKVLYDLMLDRMGLSIKNRRIDEDDRVYIVFTVEETAEPLNCGKQKAVKLCG